MSRLHTIQASIAQVAGHFGVSPVPDLTVPSETVEGLPGLVVIRKGDRPVLKSLPWGFPRQTREGRLRGDPPTHLGLVADLTNPMWDTMVADPRYRCLIVLTHFANPDGDPGEKTRTWFSVKDEPIVAWAGFCRNTEEFGPVYAGMTMEANAAIPPTNDRMPVLLMPDDYDRWLTCGIEEVIKFMYGEPIPADRMTVEQTEDRWRSGAAPPASAQLALL